MKSAIFEFIIKISTAQVEIFLVIPVIEVGSLVCITITHPFQ